MELRHRKSLPVKQKSTGKMAATSVTRETTMTAELTPRKEAAAALTESNKQQQQHALLEEENTRLRQELEDMKKALQRYEETSNSNRVGGKQVRLATTSPRSAKRPPPPTLPSLHEQSTVVQPRPQANLSSRRRSSRSPRDMDGAADPSITPTGLYHRGGKSPMITPAASYEEDEDSSATRSIGSSTSSRINTPVLSLRGRAMQPKFRNSNVFHSDDESNDEESLRQFAEGVSLISNDELQIPSATDDLKGDNDDDTGNDEMEFGRMILDRAGWLVGLLVLQSMSSFIIQHNEALLQKHLVLVRFLTMLVGAGGNAGNQASVRVIRGLAIGTIKTNDVRSFLMSELLVGICLSIILGVAGCLRAAVFLTPFSETFAITASLFMIVMISVVLGATLPLGMKMVGIDPAHSSTTIQVLMDILGVLITVSVSSLVLDSQVGTWLGFKNTAG